MSFTCLDPYVAINRFELLTGKKSIKLFSKHRLDYSINELKEKYGSDNVFLLPCGKCESCKRNKAEDWAVRCELEAKMHKFNYFLTLTYDEGHIQKAGYEDLKVFIDRLEGEKHKRKFKYFCSMEKGDLTERLHFHLILFCDFEIDIYNPVKLGAFYHYHSNLITKLWKFGLHDITPFQCTCARYVAKYTSKEGKLFMSRNIGKSYWLAYKDEIIKDNFVVYSNFGNKFHSYIPDCFIRWYDQENPTLLDDYKHYKKSLAHFVQAEHKRSLVVVHDEESLAEKQKRVIEKGKNKRRL